MRDAKGKFLAGVQKPDGWQGRPPDAGKQYVKDMCWASVNKVASLIFSLPEDEMLLWIQSNKHTLSLAERAYLEEAAGGLKNIDSKGNLVKGSPNLNVIEAILDRIIGKTLKLDSGQTERDPVIERLYQLSPGNVKAEIDRLIKVREIANAERKQIEQAASKPKEHK